MTVAIQYMPVPINDIRFMSRNRSVEVDSTAELARKHIKELAKMLVAKHCRPTMFAPPSNPSPQLQTVLRWFQAIVQWDFNALETLLSDDYLHATLPASAGDPNKNKEQGIAHAKSIAALLGGQAMNVGVQFIASNHWLWHLFMRPCQV